VSVSLEDAVGAARRPNMPGAPGRDNWSIPLPISIDELGSEPAVSRIVNVMQSDEHGL
jgi:4-alpha-glucanotransferase